MERFKSSEEERILEAELFEESDILRIPPETSEDSLESTNSNEGNPAYALEPLRPLQQRNELIYKLMATGMKAIEISEELGISLNSFYIASNKPEANMRVQFYRDKLFGNSIRKRMDSLGHKAVDKLEKLLASDSEKVSADATYYILDQNVGKAKNTIQHEGSLLSDLIDKINDAREVKELSGDSHQAPKDDLEILIDSLVPEHTVGVRNREK